MTDLDPKYRDAPRFKFADGDRRELCELLTALALERKKTATCWPARDLATGEPLVAPGDFAIYTDWDGVPVIAIEYTSVEIHRFDRVPEAFALAEGENDSLEGWRRGHRMFFERNGGWSPDMVLVCERFRIVEEF